MTTRKEIELARKVVELGKDNERLRDLVQQYQQGAVSHLFRMHGG